VFSSELFGKGALTHNVNDHCFLRKLKFGLLSINSSETEDDSTIFLTNVLNYSESTN